MSLTLNFLGGAPFQLLYDGVRVAIGKSGKFKILLVNLETTLNCLQPRIIQQIRDRNVALNLPNEIIQDLQVKMGEGIELVAKLSRLSVWNIRVWGNCCNCIKPNYTDQLDELDRSLRRLLEILKLEQMRNVTELLDVARRTFDKLDEVQRGQSEILRALQEIPGEISRAQQEIIQRIEGYGVQQTANGGGGAARALGIAFQVLFDVVTQVKVKNVVFKRLLGEFKYTMDCLKPLIEEIAASDKLLHLPKQDVENYIIEMEKGVELVHKCCKALKWASYKKDKTTNKLLRLDESLQRLFIDLKGQVERNVKEAMDLTSNIEAVIKQIGGGGVEQNDDIERESWSPLQMLKPRSPTVGLDVLNMQGARDMIEETLIDVGVVGTEGTKLVVDSTHNVQGTTDVKETCGLTWSIEGIEVKRSEGSGVVQNQTEIAVVEIKPPSATVRLDVLDVKGTGDVMETLDANVGLGVKHIEESVAPNQSEVAVAEPSSLTVGMGMQDLRRDVETMDFPRDMVSESDMGEGIKEVEGSSLVQYDQMETSSWETFVLESDMGAGVKEVEGSGVVQNDQIEISACEVPKSPSPTVGFLEDEQKKTIQDIKKELEDPEQSEESLIELLQSLVDMEISFRELKDADIGRQVSHWQKQHASNAVRNLAEQVVSKWKGIMDEWELLYEEQQGLQNDHIYNKDPCLAPERPPTSPIVGLESDVREGIIGHDCSEVPEPPSLLDVLNSPRRKVCMIIQRDVSDSVEQLAKDACSPIAPGSPLWEQPDSPSKHEVSVQPDSPSKHEVSRDGNGNKSACIDQDKVLFSRSTSAQKSVKDMSVETEVDDSYNDYLNTNISQDSTEASKEDRPKIRKGTDNFLVGLIEKSFKDSSKSYQIVERTKVLINGQPIPDHLVRKAEKLAGPIQPGDYWYDFRAGFWGVIGHSCLGIIPPNIEEFSYPMPTNCGAGNTGVYVNGRELHQRDLDLLASRGLPTTRERFYILEISGRVVDEDSGEELKSLGRLAPTMEKVKHGFGMKVPRMAV